MTTTRVDITAVDKTGKAFKSVDRNITTVAGSVGKLTGLLGGLGVGFVAVAGAGDAIRKSLEFSKSLAEVSTLVDTVTFDMKGLESAALSLSSQFGTLPVEQTKAFYQVISAGASTAAEATDILTAANKLAVGGVTNVAVAADGLTSVLNAYGDQVKGAESVSDALFVGMRAGKTTIEELSLGLGKVAPIAASLNVSFDELTASVSALTKGGISTQESITGIRAILAAVAKPTKEAADLAGELGIEFNSAGLQAKGLQGFLKNLTDATGGSTDQLAKLFGGVEALVPVMALSGQAGEDFASIMGQMGIKAGSTQDAFEKMANSPGFKIDKLMSSINSIALTLGDTLADILAPAAEAAAKALNGIFDLNPQSAVDKHKAFVNELKRELASLNDRKNIPVIGDLIFDQRQAHELEQRIEDAEADLLKMESVIEDTADAAVDLESAIKPLGKSIKETGESAKTASKGLSEAEKELDNMRRQVFELTKQHDPLSRMNAELADLVRLRDMVGMREDIFDAAATDSINRYIDSLQVVGDETKEVTAETEVMGGRFTDVFDSAQQTAISAARNIQSSFADFLFDPFKDGMDGLFKNFANTLRRMAAEVAASRILQSAGVGSIFGLGSTTAMASGGGGGGFSLSGLGSSAFDMVNSGFGASSLFNSFATSSFGQGMGMSVTGPVAGFGQLTSLGSSIGTGLATAGAGALGIGIGSAIAGDKQVFGASGTVTSAIGTGLGTAIGAAFGMPAIGAALGGVLGGAINGIFGRGPLKQKDSLIRGTIGAGGIGDDFLTATKFKAEGGLLRGDKVDRVIINANTGELINGAPGLPESGISSKLDPFAAQASEQALQIGQLFDQAIQGFIASMRSSADVLGIGTESLDEFNTWVQIASKSGEAITESQIAEEIQRIGNEMANALVPGIDSFARGGETALDALTRIRGEFTSLENALIVFGASAQEANNAVSSLGIAARTELVDIAGGIDALNAKTAFFFDNFLTLEEKTEVVFNSVDAELQKLGFSANMTREEFAALVKSLLEVDGIAAETVNTLLNLAPRFSELKDLQDQTAITTEVLAESTDGLNNVLSERLNLENRLLAMVGNTAEIRRRELEATDESNRSLVRRIHALEDEQTLMDRVGQAVAGVSAVVDAQKRVLSETLSQRTAQSRTVIEGINEAIKAREEEKIAIRSAFESALNANAEITSSVSETVAKLSGLSDLINGAVKTIAPITKADAKNQVIAAIARAKSGEFIDAEAIRDAVNRLTQQNENEFSTRLDMQRDAAKSKNLLDELGGLTDAQLSTEEKTLETLKSQAESLRDGMAMELARLDAMIEIDRKRIEAEEKLIQDLTEATNFEIERLDSIKQFAEDQFKELQGINTGTQTIAQAMQGFIHAISAVGTGGTNNVNMGGGAAPVSTQPSAPAITNSAIREFFATPRTPQEIANNAIANKVSSSRIRAALGISHKEVDDFFKNNPDIPKFATGSSFVPRTGPAIVHRGERIINADQNKDLVEQLKTLNHALLQVIFNTGSANRIFKRWDGDGLPPERVV